MGELIAWIIGWALILEYALGAATVSISWSEYLNNLKYRRFISIPYEWCHSPYAEIRSMPRGGSCIMGSSILPALFILACLTLLLIKGMQESAVVNGIIVFIKVAIVLVFISSAGSLSTPHQPSPLPDPR
jgi:APA family basic amino acid/polyamine antiporter